MPPLPRTRTMPGAAGLSAPARRLRFAGLGREAECRARETMFECARRTGIRIVGACGGRGVCGTCLVRVLSGEVEEAQTTAASVRAQAPADGWLRACTLKPLTDCTLELSARSLAPIVRAEVEGLRAPRLALEPAVRSFEVALSAPDLAHAGADADRLLEALAVEGVARIELEALRALPPLAREAGWSLKVIARGDEIIAAGLPGGRVLGLAVDLGTTNVAGFLLDLETGERLASLGIENPQAAFGADLVSRVNHAVREPQGAAELQSAAAAALSALARDLCEAVGARTDEIADVAICGNTAMHHLLLRLPVAQLGRAPYVPAVCRAMDVAARELGLPAASGARAHLLAGVGGFVGGDHVAVLLATESRWSGATALVMDIGTNTEVSLVHGGEITTVSCPSGPALEGGHISCGMRAAEGAIERVWAENGRIEGRTIGGAAPVGVCGSGVVDAVAALLAAGVIDRRGRMRPDHPAVSASGAQRAAQLAPGVAFEQGDVRAVQLAKAAIRSGIDLLLADRGIEHGSLERLLIAGAFGAYLEVESATAIGLLPPLPRERVEQVGNAAGVGVRMTLASVAARERAQRIAARCRYLELGVVPGFRDAFMRRIGFE